MTTPTNGGDKEAAPTKPQETIHLISDHDNIGETETWCGEEFASSTELPKGATCTKCLTAAMFFGRDAAQRLKCLTEASK